MPHLEPSPRARLTRILLSVLGALLLVGSIALSAGAEDKVKATDWSAEDGRGQKVDTRDYRGKVLLVFINGVKTGPKMKPLADELILKYGHNPDVGQLTLVDLSTLELYKRPFANQRIAEAQERSAKRLDKLLREHNKPPIANLVRKLHIVPDFDGALFGKYDHWDTSTEVTVVVVNKQGDPVGSFKDDQLDQLHEAVEAVLAQ